MGVSGVSIISCLYDRTTVNLATFKVDLNNGAAGCYELGYDVTMQAICGAQNVIVQALAVTGTVASGPEAGQTQRPLPALWSTYSYQGDTDTNSFCKSYTVDRNLQKSTRFHVSAKFEPAEPGELPDLSDTTLANGTPIKATANPLLRAPVFWWDRQISSDTFKLDVNGYPFLNYAGDYHDHLVEIDNAKSLLVAEFPVASTNTFIELSRTYDQAVNVSAWTFKTKTYPPRSVQCKEVVCSPMIAEGSYRYYTVTMRLAFAPAGKTWDTPMPQLGYSYFTKESDGTFKKDKDGYKLRTTVDYLVPLAEDGTRLSDDQPVLVSQLRALREVDFNTLTAGNIWNTV